MDFIVATGIECSAPIIRGGIRRDQLLMSDHWRRYEEDFDLVAGSASPISAMVCRSTSSLAIRPSSTGRGRTSRWRRSGRGASSPSPTSCISRSRTDSSGSAIPACRHRSWRMRRRSPIAIRGSAGTRPSTSRSSPPCSRPRGVGGMSASAPTGRSSEALDNVVTCAVEGMRVIRERRSDAVFLQSDACESFSAGRRRASMRRATFFTERAYLGFDLTYGPPVSPAMRAVAQPGGDDEGAPGVVRGAAAQTRTASSASTTTSTTSGSSAPTAGISGVPARLRVDRARGPCAIRHSPHARRDEQLLRPGRRLAGRDVERQRWRCATTGYRCAASAGTASPTRSIGTRACARPTTGSTASASPTWTGSAGP